MRDDGEHDERVLRGEQLVKDNQQQQPSVLGSTTRRPSKPNAYNYYQKLVQDFQSLDNELEAATHAQEDLHSRVYALQAEYQASTKEQAVAQQKQWERERELHVETLVRKSVEVESLHAEVSELDALELRLVAEIQVLQEKQREEVQSEAFRINELVHMKTHLLEAELTKGKMDLEFIAQIVKKSHSHNHEQERESAREKEAIHTIAEEIQQRRRREFDLAAESLSARLLSFEHEKQALSKKASDIRMRKQRALQILSTNQQQAIKIFFSSAPPSDDLGKKQSATSERDPDSLADDQSSSAPPQLDFRSILASLNQSGSQVGQIQTARSEKLSTRRTMEDALQDAQATLHDGEKRIEALQKIILDRKRDAEALHIFSKESVTVYDGKLGVESYDPSKYELVYFVRGLVFAWMEAAVAEAESEPDTRLLESEVQRWEIAHSAVEREESVQLLSKLAISQLTHIISEVIGDIAADIHSEFQSSCSRVSETIASVLRDVLFASSSASAISNGKAPASAAQSKIPSTSTPVLQRALFKSAFGQLQTERRRHAAVRSERTQESVQYLQRMAQPTKSVAAKLKADGKAVQAASSSPMKKRFGFFSSNRQSEKAATESLSPMKAGAQAPPAGQEPHSVDKAHTNETIELRADKSDGPDPSSRVAAEKKFWQRMLVEIDRIAAPSSFAHSTCVEVSSDGSVCAVGTASGEVLVWDLQQHPPLILRSHVPPPKATRSSISRIAISGNRTRVATLNQLKVIHVWRVSRALRGVSSDQQQHSSDCFGIGDPHKCKPQLLELLVEINSGSLRQPALPDDVKQLIPTERSSAMVLPPQFLCASWFSSTTSLGEQTSLICGVSSGDILKYNIAAAAAGSKQSRSFFDAEVVAKFDAPTPSDLTTGLAFTNIKREFFCGHTYPVLFVKCFRFGASSTRAPPNARLLSIDSGANVLEWEYDAERFSGFGWFMPVRRYHLDLQSSSSSSTSSSDAAEPGSQKGNGRSTNGTVKDQGAILQIALTADEKRVVLMVFFESPGGKTTKSGKLEFHQLLLTAAGEPIRLAPVRIQLDFAGSSLPPRFALSTVFPSGKGRDCGHFLFLLMNNSVQIVSLSTGESCCALISLQQKGEPSLIFSSIAVSERCMKKEKTHCCMAVAGEHHNKVVLYWFRQQR